MPIYYYDFEIDDGKSTQKISWSSGTGVIAPEAFVISGEKGFRLEKGLSTLLEKGNTINLGDKLAITAIDNN